jgi:type VI secretion system protein ImpL
VKPKLRIGLVAAVPLAIFMGLGAVLASALGLQGWGYRLFWMGFAFLGLLLAGAVFWFMSRMRSGRALPQGSPRSEDLSARLAAIRKRLAAARRPSMDRLPLVLLMGPSGSAKSTSVLGSDLSAEQLSGDSPRDGRFPPTESVNAWFSDGTVLVEAGADLAQDPSLWSELLRRIVPRRLLAAILTGKAQSPRAAVVCFSCEGLVGSETGPDVALSWARVLRTRLLEMSEKLGVRVPVYVLFTKADRIPSFQDYFWSLTEEEAGRVLGSTLPILPAHEAGSYADIQSRRLAQAFGDLFRSLALKRPKYLDHEAGSVRTARAYEFPREFRKLTGTASQFLLELCKPSQLQVNPFLRGFYWVGRQELPAEGPAPSRAEEAPAFTGPGGATAIFDPRALEAQARPPAYAPATPSGIRHRWLFLPRVLRDVVLRDDIAIGMMRRGTRVSLGRRLLLGTVTFAVLLVLIPFLLAAFIHNRGLQSRVEGTLAAVEEIRDWSGAGAETAEALRRLEALRTKVDTLWTYETDGPPLKFGAWLGLYTGSRLHPVALDRYADRFTTLLLSPALDSTRTELRNLPAVPGPDSDYQVTYEALRTYLMATRYPERGETDFLSAALARRWRLLQDDESLALAQRQFDFFGDRLLQSHEFSAMPADESTVVRTREFLARMGQVQPFYASLISKANQRYRTFRFEEVVAGPVSGALSVGREIPGAFSAEGHRFVRDQLSRPDSLLQAEEWVLGEVTPPNAELVARQIDSLYEREYPRRWEELLARTSVTTFRDVGDATRRLGQLAGDDSPLTRLLITVSNNVFEGPESAAARFRPLNAFLPRDSAGTITLSQSAMGYFDALDGLRSAMEEMDRVQGSARLSAVEGIVLREIPDAQGVLRQIRREMGTDPQGRDVANSLGTILTQPIERAEGLIRGAEPAELNRRGAEFCTEYNRLVGSRYPFQATSTEEPNLDDLAAVFQRDVSLVWNLAAPLEPYMERSGPTYQQRSGSSVQINPVFLEFYANARRFSEALYEEGAEAPQVEFSIRPSLSESSQGVESITLRMDGRETVCTELDCRTLRLGWEGSPSSEVELTARVGGQEVRIFGPFRGTWATFRLFAEASGWRSPGQQHTVRWQVRGTQHTVAAVVDLGRLPAVFSTTLMRDLRCVPQIAGRP